MCTVSWLRGAAGYDLFCNRDERRARARALPPTVRDRVGVRYVAPADGDFGGSWIAANEHGLTLCLLNGYEDEETRPREGTQPPAGERSRGLLLIDLIDCRAAAQARARLAASTDLPRYRSFTLLALDAAGAGVAARWAGGRLMLEDEPRAPMTSSSFETAAVRAAREGLFRRTVAAAGESAGAELFAQFHRSHEPARGPYSVCMHRGDAATASFSRVRVRGGRIEFEYQSGAPCEGGTPVKIVLPRAGVRA